jgi:hypothetical protein
MASEEVREAIRDRVTELATPWPVFDMSDYITIEEILSTQNAESVLLQYVVSDEEIRTIGNQGNHGWEESGTVLVHLFVPTGRDSLSTVIKGDTIRKGIRGKRLTNSVTIESMAPFVDFGSGSVGVEGAFHGWSAPIFYVRRDCG